MLILLVDITKKKNSVHNILKKKFGKISNTAANKNTVGSRSNLRENLGESTRALSCAITLKNINEWGFFPPLLVRIARPPKPLLGSASFSIDDGNAIN